MSLRVYPRTSIFLFVLRQAVLEGPKFSSSKPDFLSAFAVVLSSLLAVVGSVLGCPFSISQIVFEASLF
jgi:hypothetical protein